jgi:hypothetical protein
LNPRGGESMPAVTIKKQKAAEPVEIKKMRNYSSEPAFKKKAAKASELLKKHGLPEAFTRKK